MPSYGSVARRSAAWGIVRESHNEVLGLITAMLMARLLTPYDFGVGAAASFFLGMAGRLTRFGFNTALVRMKELRPEHGTSVFVVNLVIGIGWALVFAVSGPLLGRLMRNDDAGRVISVAGVSYLIGAFGTVPAAMMARNFMFRQQTYVDWASTWTYALVAPPLALLGYGYWSIVAGQLVASVVQVSCNLYLSPFTPAFRFSRSAIADLFSFGMGIYAKRSLDYAAQSLDNLIVGRLLGMTALGFYDKGFSLMNRLVERTSIGIGTSLRIYALIFEEHDRFRRGYRKQATALGLIALPALATAAVMGQELLTLLFGDRWLASTPPFQLLCLAGALKIVNLHNSAAVQAVGHIWSEVWRQAAFVILLVVLVWLGSFWGIVGAAAGVLSATAAMTCFMLVLLRSISALRWSDLLMPMVPGLLCTAGVLVCVGATRAALLWYGVDDKYRLAIGQVLAAGLWYAAFLRWARFVVVRELVEEALDEVRPRLRQLFVRNAQ